MNASDLPALAAQWRMPVSCAKRSTTSGRVASSRTTTSGFTARMTEASDPSRPAPPRRMLYERMRTSVVVEMNSACTTRLTRPTCPTRLSYLLNEREIRLVEKSPSKLNHDIAGGLDIDGPSSLHHQCFAKRNQ